MDVSKQIEYWQAGSAEDLAAAHSLLEKGHFRHALFFAHLALEKLLKAHIVRVRAESPPRIHDLLRLVSMTGIPLSEEQTRFLARFQQYCLEGRYPDYLPASPTRDEAESGLQQAKQVLSWLTTLFN